MPERPTKHVRSNFNTEDILEVMSNGTHQTRLPLVRWEARSCM